MRARRASTGPVARQPSPTGPGTFDGRGSLDGFAFFQAHAHGVMRKLLLHVFVDAVQSQIHVQAFESDRAYGNRFVYPIGIGVAIDVDLPAILRYEQVFAQALQAAGVGVELFPAVDALGGLGQDFDDQARATDIVVFMVLRVAGKSEVWVVESMPIRLAPMTVDPPSCQSCRTPGCENAAS